MVNVPIATIKEIVGTLNYAKCLLTDKEPNEIIDNLEDVIMYFDGLIIEQESL